jgi:hypothetical protein
MTDVALVGHETRSLETEHGLRDSVLDRLCGTLFATLTRKDQRERGRQYVRGLLELPGRKTIRNIASLLGEPAVEQRLHHFVVSSTWDWRPIRGLLARYVAEMDAPIALVVRPTFIPKVGVHSVGVSRRFVPELGRVISAQLAVGVWLVSPELSCPINWQLVLDDGPGAASGQKTMLDCALAALAEVTEDARFADLPVVADARHWDLLALADRLADRDQPFLVGVPGSTQLTLPLSARVGRGGERLPARQIMAMAKDLRRPVGWLEDESGELGERVSLAAGVPVYLPGAGGPGTLLGVAGLGEDWPAELWLAGGSGARAAELFPLTRLPGRVDRDFTEITDRVGIRDFTGRSYEGWHRHVTLASIAHAVEALNRRFSRRRAPLRVAG